MHGLRHGLEAFLLLYATYGLAKFVEVFVRPDVVKLKGLERAYRPGSRIISTFDTVMLVFMIVVVAVAFSVGVDYLSFVAGLLVGMTLIQIFFHRFAQPVRPELAPEPPITPLKLMSYAIQAAPAKAWREFLL